MRLAMAVCTVLACALLASCHTASVKPEPLLALSSDDINEIRNLDELVALRTELASRLVGKSKRAFSEDYASLAQIERQIIEVEKAELNASLASKRLKSGVVALSDLIEIERNIIDKNNMTNSQLVSFKKRIQAEREKTNNYLVSLENKVAKSAHLNNKLSIYNELFSITGQEKWATRRAMVIEKRIAQLRDMDEKTQLKEEGRKSIALIKPAITHNYELKNEIANLEAEIYPSLFFEYLAQGRTDDAYKMIAELSESPDFDLLRKALSANSEKMASLYIQNADASVKNPDKLAQSYRWYRQTQHLRSILGLEKESADAFRVMSDQLYDKAQILNRNQEPGAALAYLYAIQTLHPKRSGLQKALSEQEKRVTDFAFKKIAIMNFRSSFTDRSHADTISSFLAQYVSEQQSHEVKVVDFQQLKSLLLRAELDESDARYLLVRGRVLESKVEQTENKTKKNMRVIVDKDIIPNPRYIDWLELPSSDRKGVKKPSEIIEDLQYENIEVAIIHHDKVGLFSVAFQLVEWPGERVIFSDTLSLSKEYSGEHVEDPELEALNIHLESTELPSDSAILDDLVEKVSLELGAILIEVLKDQEKKYIESAASYAQKKECAGQVSELGNALMIMKLKNMDSAELLQVFQDEAIRCYR